MSFVEVASAITALLGALALFLAAWDIRKSGKNFADAVRSFSEGRRADGEGIKAQKEGVKAEAEALMIVLLPLWERIDKLEARVRELEDKLDDSQYGNKLLIEQLERLGQTPVWRPGR